MNEKPVCYMMIGLPGSGKDTWIANNNPDSWPIVSTDKYIENVAEESGLTYNEVFKDEISISQTRMNQEVDLFCKNKKNFIWNQTNINKKTRKKKLKKLLSTHNVFAIVCSSTDEKLKDRNNDRKTFGRSIPEHIIESMKQSFECPLTEEGFIGIIHVHT